VRRSQIFVVNRHAATAIRLSVADVSGAALSAAHPEQNRHATPASTFNMGRRIIAERRRPRRGRRRRHVPPVYVAPNTRIDPGTDDSLRAFVRVLARQAAREVFESELKRRSGTIK
jgi:hypothetical protein